MNERRNKLPGGRALCGTTHLIVILCSVWLLHLCAGQAVAQARQAQLPWWDRAAERSIGGFWIKSDLPSTQVNEIGRLLNVMQGEYIRRLGDLPVRGQERRDVLVFSTRDEFEFTLRTRYAVNPPDDGRFIVAPAERVLAFWTENRTLRQIEQIIQREGFRQFAYERFGDDLPVWLNEGLANLFGEAVLAGDMFIFGQSTPRQLDAIKRAIEAGTQVPVSEILHLTPAEWPASLKNEPMSGSAGFRYGQARSMALFMLQGDSGRYAEPFRSYLRNLNIGVTTQIAFDRAFGPDHDAFENAWKRWALAAEPDSFITALDRIEFLAAGTLELSRRKIYPTSLEDLKAQLRAISFTFSRDVQGQTISESADDDSLFEIPKDALCPLQPVFVLTKPRPSLASRREQELEQANPTPPGIATDHLRPTGVQVHWLRDRERNEFQYEILIR